MQKSALTMFENATVRRTGSGLVLNCFIFYINYDELSALGAFFLTWKNSLFSVIAYLRKKGVTRKGIGLEAVKSSWYIVKIYSNTKLIMLGSKAALLQR